MRSKYIFPIILVLVLFSSCTTHRYIYAPATPNLPYFTEKGDAKVAAYYGGAGGDGNNSSRADGFDLQGAYAITDHWMLISSYFFRNENDLESNYQTGGTDNRIYYKRNILEIGGGYFVVANEKKTISMNFLASGGVGKFTINEKGGTGNNQFYDVKVFKYYLQPSIHFWPERNFSLALFVKPTFVRYGKYHTDYNADQFKEYGFASIYNRTLSFFEIGYDIKFTIPGIHWISIEHTVSGISRNYLDNTPLISRGGNASIGINVNFAKLPKRKNLGDKKPE